MKPFQHIVIQLLWKNTRFLHLSLALYSDCDENSLPITVISESMLSYWLLRAVLSSRWCRYKLIGCWNKWHASCSKTGLWQQQCLQVTLSVSLSRAETGQFTSAATFPAAVSSCCESSVQTGLLESDNKQIKHKPERKQEGRGTAKLLPEESHATCS